MLVDAGRERVDAELAGDRFAGLRSWQRITSRFYEEPAIAACSVWRLAVLSKGSNDYVHLGVRVCLGSAGQMMSVRWLDKAYDDHVGPG